MAKMKSHILVFGLYLILALFFTWPLVTKITTNGFGHDEDAPYHIWHNWWLKYSLFDLKQSPLHTDYIFHPQKINLIYDANSFVFATMTIPFQFITNNVVLSSNIIFIISFALSGLAAFLLARHLIKNRWIAFFCGFIFAFNPYTTAQALDGHTNLTTTWLIPLYTYFLLRSLNNNLGSGVYKLKISNFKFQIAAGLVAALQLYSDFTYTTFMVVETCLIFLYFLVEGKNHLKKTLKEVLITGFLLSTTAGILSFPILSEVMKASREGFRVGSPLWVQNVWSADLLTFIRPNDQTTFLKNPWTPNIGTVEGTAFLGYGLILLVLTYLTIMFIKKFKRSTEESLALFLSVSFFLLMLGPSIHLRNNFQFPVLSLSKDQLIFPLPYLLLHKIPFIGETQEPGRMFPFLILPLSLLSGFALNQMSNLTSKRRWKFYLILCLFFSVTVFEYLTIPFPSTDLSSKTIFDTIRNDPSKKAVLTLPLGFNSGNYVLGQSPIGSLQFYQAYFQKPSFRATVARLPYSNFEYYQKLPFLPYLIDPENSVALDDLIKNKEETKKIFKERLNIKYVVIFEKKYKKSLDQTVESIEQVLDGQKFYDDESIKAYRL